MLVQSRTIAGRNLWCRVPGSKDRASGRRSSSGTPDSGPGCVEEVGVAAGDGHGMRWSARDEVESLSGPYLNERDNRAVSRHRV